MTGVPERVRPILVAAARGELPPRIALMQLAMETTDAGQLAAVLRAGGEIGQTEEERARLAELAVLAERNPQTWNTVKSVIEAIAHGAAATSDPAEHVQALAAMFDRAASASPEASVALYSLGDAQELARSADEVSLYLARAGIVAPDRSVLEIGCGIGRFLVSLAPRVREMVGIDISPVMIAEARHRIAGLRNARATLTTGLDLAEFVDNSFDAVLAIDSFPYVVDAGGALPERMFAEASRVLRPGGDFVVCNFSYRGDPDRDRRDAEAFGDAAGLVLRLGGEQPFTLWDGTVFWLSKA